MSGELGIPSRLIERVLGTLVLARLVVEVSAEQPAYAPARPLEAINCHHILLAMRALQGQELVTRDEPVREEVYGEFARIQAAEKAAASSVTMQDLVNRAHARLELAPLVADAAVDSSRAAKAPVTELPNEPVTTIGTPPPPAEMETLEAPPSPNARPDKDIEPIRPINDPSTDDERNFPL
jgi:DNA-binding IscR family transcriptional regulator